MERAISSIGMNEEMIREMFASGPQAPQHAVFGHVTAKLAEAIRASQQSGDSLVKIADASTKAAPGQGPQGGLVSAMAGFVAVRTSQTDSGFAGVYLFTRRHLVHGSSGQAVTEDAETRLRLPAN